MPQIAIHQNCMTVSVKRKFTDLYSFLSEGLDSILEMQKLFHFQIGECGVQMQPFAAECVEVHVARQERQALSGTPHGITDFLGVLDT